MTEELKKSKELLENVRNIMDSTLVESYISKTGESLSLFSLFEMQRQLWTTHPSMDKLRLLAWKTLGEKNIDCRCRWIRSEAGDKMQLLLDDTNQNGFCSLVFQKIDEELQLIEAYSVLHNEDMKKIQHAFLTDGFDAIQCRYEELAYFHSEIGKSGEYRFTDKGFHIIVSNKEMVVTTEKEDVFKDDRIPANSFSLKYYIEDDRIRTMCRTSLAPLEQMIYGHELAFLKHFFIKIEWLPEALQPLIEKRLQAEIKKQESSFHLFQKMKTLFKKKNQTML